MVKLRGQVRVRQLDPALKKRKNKKEKRLSDIIWYSTFQQMALIQTSIKLDLYKVLVFYKKILPSVSYLYRAAFATFALQTK